jgi:hypothetical protein
MPRTRKKPDAPPEPVHCPRCPADNEAAVLDPMTGVCRVCRRSAGPLPGLANPSHAEQPSTWLRAA